jgi:hypothetical protein
MDLDNYYKKFSDFTSMKQIKSALDAGKQNIYWQNEGYAVFKDRVGQYLICFKSNEHCVGLFHLDGVNTEYAPSQFFIGPDHNYEQSLRRGPHSPGPSEGRSGTRKRRRSSGGKRRRSTGAKRRRSSGAKRRRSSSAKSRRTSRGRRRSKGRR